MNPEDRYELIEQLGRGGMGEVYRAYDRKIERFVAVKLLYRDEVEVVARFQREARLQARVKHEHIGAVYEVGELNGRPFIAMQLIEGAPLNWVAHQLSLEARIRVIQKVAEAVHAAHRDGLIHRDLKPANVLVEQKPDGRWFPYVLDFGIARDVAATQLTRTGYLVGTPGYLAPESVLRGAGAADRRSDVYSLGVMLFEVLTGRRPFQGAYEVEETFRATQEDAPPPSRYCPSLPRDLDGITLMALEREPGRRYESARAFAEDLERFLDGLPVLARPAGTWYHALKWGQRNRRLLAVSGAALVALATFVGFHLRQRWELKEQAELARRFSEEAERFEANLRYAKALPRHDIRPARQQIRERLHSMETQIERLSGLAEGPGHYAMGRAFLALDRPSQALPHLERAWEAGLTEPEVAVVLAEARGVRYREALDRAYRIADPDVRKAELEAIERRLRAGVVEMLARSWAVSAGPPPALLEGRLALYERRYDSAVEAANRAVQGSDPVAAHALAAHALQFRAREAAVAGRFSEALEGYEAAAQHLARALEIGRSDPALYEAECRRLTRLADVLGWTGQDPLPMLDRAEGACDHGLVVDPDHDRLLALLAETLLKRARLALNAGNPPGRDFDRALELAKRASKLNPQSPAGPEVLGFAYTLRGWLWELQHGEDPSASLQAALKAYLAAQRADPHAVDPVIGAATVLAIRAQFEASKGRDPRGFAAEAMGQFERAMTVAPVAPRLFNNASNLLVRVAEYEIERGLDAAPRLRQAIELSQRGLANSPAFASLHNIVGVAHLDLGQIALNFGRDPSAELDAALDSFALALQHNPNYLLAENNRALAAAIRAERELALGQSPERHLDEAIATLQRTLERNPGFGPEAHRNLAWALLLRTESALAHRRPTQEPLAAARQATHRGLQRYPTFPLLHAQLAIIEVVALEASRERGVPALSAWQSARQAVEGALAQEQVPALALLAAARLARLEAEWRRPQGEDVSESVQKGILVTDRLLQLNPRHAAGHAEKALLLALAGDLEAGQEELQKALALDSTVLVRHRLEPLVAKLFPKESEALTFLSGADRESGLR